MKRKGKKFIKKGSNSLNKLSLFQKNDGKFNKSCPLSIKNAPVIDYKNISLLKKYISENLRLSLIVINFSLVQIFFIFLPSGQFFNNYLSILYYLPLGIFLNLYYKYINVRK